MTEPLNNPYTLTDGQLKRIVQDYNSAAKRRQEEEHQLLSHALLAQLIISVRVLTEKIDNLHE